MGLAHTTGLEDEELGLDESGQVLHEDRCKRKVKDMHDNNLDLDDVILDTSTLVSPVVGTLSVGSLEYQVVGVLIVKFPEHQ